MNLRLIQVPHLCSNFGLAYCRHHMGAGILNGSVCCGWWLAPILGLGVAGPGDRRLELRTGVSQSEGLTKLWNFTSTTC